MTRKWFYLLLGPVDGKWAFHTHAAHLDTMGRVMVLLTAIFAREILALRERLTYYVSRLLS